MNATFKLKSYIRKIIFFALILSAQHSFAQGTRSDYERAMNLQKTTADKVFRDRVTPHWMKDNKRFWYRNDLPENKREFIFVDAEKGVRQRAFDHERLAKFLAKVTNQEAEAEKLAIDHLIFDENGSTLTFSFNGNWWKCDLNSYKIEATSRDETPASSLEPLRRWRSSRRTGEETSITFINRTDKDVDIYWIDSERQRKYYATVAAADRHRQHTFAGHVWLVTDKNGEPLLAFMADEQAADAVIDDQTIKEAANRKPQREADRPRSRAQSPDGKWSASIKDYNLYVRNLETDEETALTEDGTEEDAYSERFYWSPDSSKLVVLRRRKGDDRKVYIIESSPDDQLQPKLHNYSYLKPGDKIPLDKPHLFHISDKKHIAISDELFPNPWSISEIRWSPDSSRFTFLYNQRGHQVLRIISVDASTGRPRAIVDEQSETFIDYAGKQFSHYIEDTKKSSGCPSGTAGTISIFTMLRREKLKTKSPKANG